MTNKRKKTLSWIAFIAIIAGLLFLGGYYFPFYKYHLNEPLPPDHTLEAGSQRYEGWTLSIISIIFASFLLYIISLLFRGEEKTSNKPNVKPYSKR